MISVLPSKTMSKIMGSLINFLLDWKIHQR